MPKSSGGGGVPPHWLGMHTSGGASTIVSVLSSASTVGIL